MAGVGGMLGEAFYEVFNNEYKHNDKIKYQIENTNNNANETDHS